MSFLSGALPTRSGMSHQNPNPHRPGRARKIDDIIGTPEGRPSEIVSRLVESLGKRGVNAILNNSNGIDPRINEEVLLLVRAVREFIGHNEKIMVTTIKSRQGFERTNLLNATPIRYLVKVHNYLIDLMEFELAKEVERAIDRNGSSVEYKKQTIRIEKYSTGVKLQNRITEEGEMAVVKYFPVNKES